jgi:hypothetical protein
MDTIEQLHHHGLNIEAKDGSLIVSPRDRITDEIREYIRQHKAAILAELEAESRNENFQERAAILEFDGGMERSQAEQEAARLVFCSACCHSEIPDVHRPRLLTCSANQRGGYLKWASEPAWCDQFKPKKDIA